MLKIYKIDNKNGLRYYWNQWASKDGCFITQDPARDGSNWYGYCGQNPITFQDQSGLIYYTGPTGSSVQSSIDYVGVTGSTGGECHGSGVSIMPDIPDNLSVEEQMQILEDITNREYENEQQKANGARYLRTIMRNTKKFNLDGLFNLDGNEIFMNETLRDFLNTSDSGYDYRLEDMTAENGWTLVDSSGAMEHQRTAGILENQKWVNKDGREAIFRTDDGNNWNLVTGGSLNAEMDKGTYNYAIHTSRWCDWTSFSKHGRWDMDPYFRQWNYTPFYRSLFGHDFSNPGFNRHYDYMYKVR